MIRRGDGIGLRLRAELSPARPTSVREHDGLHPVAQVELGQAVRDVGLDGGLAQDEPFGDLGVGQSLAEQLQHLALALGEPVEQRGVLRRRARGGAWRGGHLGDDAAGDLGREQGVAAPDGADRLDELVGLAVLEQEAAGPGVEAVEEVVVAVEGGEDDDLAEVLGDDARRWPRCRR